MEILFTVIAWIFGIWFALIAAPAVAVVAISFLMILVSLPIAAVAKIIDCINEWRENK